MNSRRMESQIVRDSLLAIAGSLDRSIGGPSIDPAQPSVRRSIYFKHSRDQQDKFLSMFDDADLLQCYRRSESVVPQQSLALFNSKLSLDTAEKIAVRIRQSVGAEDWNPFVDAVFVALLGRQPNDQERQECQKFRNQLDGLLNGHSDPTGSKRIDARFVHAIMNHNDFVSIR